MSKRMAVACILAQSIIYGIGDPISKYAFDVMSVYPALILRYSIALVAIMLLAGKYVIEEVKSKSLRPLLLPGVCIGTAYVTGNVGLSLTEATTVAFLRSLAIVFTPVMAFAVYKTTCGWKQVPIILLMLAGLYLLCGVAEQGISAVGAGELLTLVSALCLAGALVFGQNALISFTPLTLTTVQTACTAVITFGAALLFRVPLDFSRGDVPSVCIVAYLAIACTIGGYLLQNSALGVISAKTTALLQCSCPVLTAFFSYVLIDERLSVYGMVGCVIILICLVLQSLIKE